MATIERTIKNIDEQVQAAARIIGNLDMRKPDLQEMKNAANQAGQVVQDLNRLIGTVIAKNDAAPHPLDGIGSY